MKYILDNSNIAESYSGVTTPLTYSFASHVYREVYKVFCKNMGVSKTIARRHEEEISSLLGFVGYRMYYNLQNWYTLISFLPAYQFNRQFFDRMVGVETGHSPQAAFPKASVGKYGIQLPRVVAQALRISLCFLFMGVLVRKFNGRFDRTFAHLDSIDLGRLDPKELAGLYVAVSDDLLPRWWVPIANDFALMVSAGIAAKVLSSGADQTGGAAHLYLKARGSLMSLDPGQRLAGLVWVIKNDPAILDLFRQRLPPAHLLALLSERHPDSAAHRGMVEYLGRYGARVPNELKLESETFRERPEILVSLLQGLVQTDPVDSEIPRRRGGAPQSQRLHLSPPSPRSLPSPRSPMKRALAAWALSWAGKSIARREETRFRRALIFGYARRVFLAIGRRFHEADVLSEPRDIFFLMEDEVFGLVEGALTAETARALVLRRKTELEEWKLLELPRRIESEAPYDELLATLKRISHRSKGRDAADRLTGKVAARGEGPVVRGTALVLPEFSPSAAFQGKVLVTRQTDPGWTVVFPFVKALIVERGGILSHAAIVARELGIPCIVGVADATSLIPDGASVELWLDTGEILVHPRDGESGSVSAPEALCVS
jgi:pyruvate,water dikinase